MLEQFQQPDVTRLTSSSKLDMFEADPPNYHATASHQPPGTSHHAGNSHHAGISHHGPGGGGLLQQLLSPSSDNIFRPIQQTYMIQTSPHQQTYLGSRDRNLAGPLLCTYSYMSTTGNVGQSPT